MFNKTMWFSLILSLTSVALAQGRVQPQPSTMQVEATSSQATQTCKVTYSSGTFYTATKFCVTVNGNIPQFSVRGNQLFFPAGNAGDLEGYGVCDVTAGQRYYDYAAYDNGSWNASTLTQNGNTVTVTRTTADGNWQLTQIIVNLPATANTVGSARVTMKLKNLTNVRRSVTLVRYAAENVAGLKNIYNTTEYTASGQLEFVNGLTITVSNFPPGFAANTFVQSIQSGPDPCLTKEFSVVSPPYNGLGSIAAEWALGTNTLGPGSTATVISTYTPF